MNRTINLLFLIIFCICSQSCSINSSSYKNNFVWHNDINSLPANKDLSKQFGLASPLAGTHNGAIIVAGGCNFPNKPVEEGGAKKYYNDIFVLSENSTEWITGNYLPYDVAYGASVDTPYGVLFIGGENSRGRLDDVTLVSWKNGELKIDQTKYPKLPIKLSSFDATVAGGYVYIAGGASDEPTQQNHFLRLKLDGGKEWQRLDDFPSHRRLQPVLVTQNGAESVNIYLFGGSQTTSKDNDPTVATGGYLYNTTTKKWTHTSDCVIDNTQYALHGSDAIAIGKSHIMFIGGVNYDIFLDAITRENNPKKTNSQNDIDSLNSWKKGYYLHDPSWYKFSDKIIIYNTITNTWSIGAKYPNEAVAGAKLIPYKEQFIVINGEIKPGVRTANVYNGEIINTPSFGVVNWIVLAAYLLGMVFMGAFFMNRNKNADDFFKGGGRIPWWAVGISLFATMLSAITFMAIPAKVFATDWKYFPMGVTILVMTWPVIKYYLPFFCRLNITTAYEYLEKRFNYSMRFMASALFIIFMIARMALTLYLPSLALTTVTDIDIYLCITLMGVITLVYCTMGGVEAVIWSDVVQGIILVGGALITIVFIIIKIPCGISEIFSISIENSKFTMFDLSLSLTSPTFWVVILGGVANNLISYTSDQTVIQRYITTTSEKAAARSIKMNGYLAVVATIVFYFIGTSLYAFYKTYPTDMNFEIQNIDSVFPHFIMTEMPVGLAGLLIAAIFAASMSTVSSNINSLSTAFTVDIYRRFTKTDKKRELFIARLLSVAFGIIGVLAAIIIASWNILSLLDLFNYLLGLLSSSLAALFLIGIFIPRIGTKSTLYGFILGNISIFLVSIYTDLSFLLYGFFGLAFTVTYSYIFSFFFKNNKDIEGVTWKSLRKNSEN